MSSSSAARAIRLPQPCPHLAAYRSGGGGNSIRSLHRCLRPRPPSRAEVRRDPGEVPFCASCPPAAVHRGVRLYACLSCAAVSCHAHAPDHAALRPGHEIALDVDRAELFCAACRDQVYDPDFDAAVLIALTSLSCSRLPTPPPPAEKWTKRRRVEYRPWVPDPKERAVIGWRSSPLLVQEGNASSASSTTTTANSTTTTTANSTTTTTSSPSPSASSPSSLPRGLRGFNNLGNTCFMNSVLQALLHTPLLRNYFLSDRHNRYVCQLKSKKKGGIKEKSNAVERKNPARESHVCLACDLDAMYSAVFSGDRKPFSPANFLYRYLSPCLLFILRLQDDFFKRKKLLEERRLILFNCCWIGC